MNNRAEPLDAICAQSRAIRRERDVEAALTDEGFFSMGVFVHNQWERACVVPVPYRDQGNIHDKTSSKVGHLKLEAWITKPFESRMVNWTLVTKETDTYVVHYYSMTAEESPINKASTK
ncbi:hypothetical protein F5887DRAFT_1087433 [Amanita rubescens]|nr:hypothetical protein F5887DRAFT_1087433 [Amanita rubescens]